MNAGVECARARTLYVVLYYNKIKKWLNSYWINKNHLNSYRTKRMTELVTYSMVVGNIFDMWCELHFNWKQPICRISAYSRSIRYMCSILSLKLKQIPSLEYRKYVMKTRMNQHWWWNLHISWFFKSLSVSIQVTCNSKVFARYVANKKNTNIVFSQQKMDES